MLVNPIQAALQVVAVVAILISGILLTDALIALTAVRNTLYGIPDGVQVQISSAAANAGLLGLLTAAMPAIWGVVLFATSPRIAALILRRQRPA
ncbi:MAG: hypothetical protein D6702_00945 [Planctomycetota bacterium]|nr:MAG: hypothetical protein D6702_00945 [Planctomycetota bacterium]